MYRNIQAFLVLCILATASVVHADPLFTVPTVSVTELGAMITSILAALALLWGARKAIKAINRS